MARKKVSTILKASIGGMMCMSFLFVSATTLTASAAGFPARNNMQQGQMMGQQQMGQQQMGQQQMMGQPQMGQQQMGQQQMFGADSQNQMMPGQEGMMQEGMMQEGMMQEGMMQQDQLNNLENLDLATEPSEILTGITSNSAMNLTADTSNATTYVMSDTDNTVKIDTAGTYIVTGSCSDGNIVVKKNTTGVVLVLKDLNLTSTTGATLSCNKYSETKIIIEGTVSLTDAENPADETSSDADVADAFDGAALKVKDGASAYITGSGTLNIDGSSCKNGIKVGNEDSPSLVIDSINLNISAANDAINSGYDLAILSGNLSIYASDDGIHADRIVTIGDSGNGPSINIKNSYEGIEGTVVNLFGGNTNINASDDAVNAANSDGTYASLGYSINITGGTHTINCSGDGLDSNGNVNITGGSTTINSGSTGGEAGIDYIGTCYIADGTLTNNSGMAADGDMMMGQQQMGQQQMGQQQMGQQQMGQQQMGQPQMGQQQMGQQQMGQPQMGQQQMGQPQMR
ncbi:MAG: carbohydrate-binding domain-containing protein [Pseudobutyrivibrio sp.]|nr:carbohydrate-binding domain-containing protein [Pseudobutyrivibrio sp.]